MNPKRIKRNGSRKATKFERKPQPKLVAGMVVLSGDRPYLIATDDMGILLFAIDMISGIEYLLDCIKVDKIINVKIVEV